MSRHLNIEFKAKCQDHDHIRGILKKYKAKFIGTDFQKDVYFFCQQGRLKLRVGNIENNLIHYHRDNKQGPKKSDVTLYNSSPEKNLEQILSQALGVRVIVSKKREIYFIENAKIHLDEVDGLGKFVEVEAISDEKLGVFDEEYLEKQCEFYKKEFKLDDSDMIEVSYSDLLIEKNYKSDKADRDLKSELSRKVKDIASKL